MTHLNSLFYEPSELPLMKTSPERLTKGFASRSLSKTLTKALLLALSALASGALLAGSATTLLAPTAQAKTPLQEVLVCPECRMVAVTNPYRWVDPLVIKFTWISAPAAKALSSRYLRKPSCNTNAPFVRRNLSNAQCFTQPHRMRSPFSLN
jgi:hypothetical protein